MSMPYVGWWTLGALGPLGNTSLALVILVIAFLQQRHRFSLPANVRTPLLWCIGAMWLSAAFSPLREISLGVAAGYSMIWLLLWSSAPAVVDDAQVRSRLFQMVCISGVCAAVLAFVSYFVLHQARAQIFGLGSPGLGTTLVLATGIGIGYLQRTQKGYWWVAYLALMTAGLFFTYTRGAWLGYAVMIGLYSLRNRKFLLVLLCIVLAGLAFAILIPEQKEYLALRFAYGDNGRYGIWATSAEIIKANPVLGVGPGVHPMVYDQYRVPSAMSGAGHAHNAVLGYFADLGILGGIPMLWLLALTAWAGMYLVLTTDTQARGLGAAMLGVLVHQVFDIPIYGLEIGGLFWAFSAVTVMWAVRLRATTAIAPRNKSLNGDKDQVVV